MSEKVIAIYCFLDDLFLDDLFKEVHFNKKPTYKVSDAVVLTTAIVADNSHCSGPLLLGQSGTGYELHV